MHSAQFEGSCNYGVNIVKVGKRHQGLINTYIHRFWKCCIICYKLIIIFKALSLEFSLHLWLTNLPINAIDPLHMPGHDINGCLFGSHLLIEQMICLQIQHASRLLLVDLVDILASLAEVMSDWLRDVRPVQHFESCHCLFWLFRWC